MDEEFLLEKVTTWIEDLWFKFINRESPIATALCAVLFIVGGLLLIVIAWGGLTLLFYYIVGLNLVLAFLILPLIIASLVTLHYLGKWIKKALH